MIDWLVENQHTPITGFEQLSKGQLVCGTVIRKHPKMGYFVELAGGSALSAPARFVHAERMPASAQELQIGQTVVARVSSIDPERKRFALILDVGF
ncbi:unnamed protein product [Gongylonema pulchrum]|uniref:S1 motif domain-containing protein n=1 Tax=Gongylonema pulchrum TaxID=637853 RepID=A0A183DJJ8_9BILA|nr:unnamed protein product [Gongylonema pulchrum]